MNGNNARAVALLNLADGLDLCLFHINANST